MNIGNNPTHQKFALGDATIVIQEQTFLDARCKSVFGWGGVDPDRSTQSFWGNLGTDLYEYV